MTNIALGKLPLEKNWLRPEEATNGLDSEYTGDKGFAEAAWPTTFTLDLGRKVPIHSIQFLLWDNLGSSSNKLANREYFYLLSISENGLDWESYYLTTVKGYVGWQLFEFKFLPEAQYVKVDCLFNTANDGFHIVEFEVYDSKPDKKIPPNRITNRNFLFYPIQAFDERHVIRKTESIINQKFQEARRESDALLSKANDAYESILKFQTGLQSKEEGIDRIIQQLDLSSKIKYFADEAEINRNSANIWLRWTVFCFVTFFSVLTSFLVWNGYYFVKISEKVGNDVKTLGLVSQTLTFEFISFLAAKILLVSTLLYLAFFCVKNYRSQKHNYIVNQHKAMSLTSANSFISRKDVDEKAKEKIITQAMSEIFSHQQSGYTDKDGELNPNIITSIVETTKK